MEKALAREILSKIRKKILQRDIKQKQVFDKLFPLLTGKSAFIYVSFGQEMSTHSIIEKCFSQSGVAVPFVLSGEMQAKRLINYENLLVNPKNGNLINAELGEEICPDIVVVPLLGFNKSCFRLGYGGGYYDKFLAKFSGEKIGIAFDEQLFDIPVESFDVPLNKIITPQNIYIRK